VKILFANHVTRIGGAELSLLELMAGLDRGRFRPSLAVPDHGPLAQRAQALGIPVCIVPFGRVARTRNPLRLARFACTAAAGAAALAKRVRAGSVDVVHANSNAAQLVCGPAARRAGVPCIWHSRDLVSLRPLGAWMARRAAAVVAISRAVAEHLRRQGVPADAIRVVYNGIDAARVDTPAARAATRRELGAGPSASVVAMVGQLAPWKRHADFLRVAARVSATRPEAIFMIAGEDLFGDHPGYRAGLEALARDLGLEGRVRLLGWRDDLAALLAASDVVVHPAQREPFGRAVAEAMAAGMPVAAVRAGGPAELIQDGESGVLVAPGDLEAMAAAVASLCADAAWRARMGRSAQARIRESFSLAATIRNMEGLYDACGR
jgi:glycosyltransferase involved in cell wall biosynthesis